MENVLSAEPVRAEKMSPWQLFCFGVLTVPLAMGGLALVLFLPTYYAVEIGLGFTATGVVFALGRIFDVITDPVVGYLSDETRSRFGPRKPWIVLGVPAFCLAAWMLLSPPANAGLAYLLLASSLYFLFYTVLDVPYSSIGLEISPHEHERSILAGSKAAFQVVGAIAAASMPYWLGLPMAGSLRVTAVFVILLSVIGLLLFLFFVPGRVRHVAGPRAGLRSALARVSGKRAYNRLVAAFFIVQSANALTGGLMVLYVTHIVGAPHLVGLFLGLLFLSTALFLPVWIFLSMRYSKRTAWLISMLGCCLVLAAAPLIEAGDVMSAAILCCLIGTVFGCDAIMPTSILADIIYDDELSGSNRLGGLALAIKNALSKLTFIIPMGLAFPVLDLVDFNKTGENGDLQRMTLLFFFTGLPVLLRIGAFLAYRKAPLPAIAAGSR